MKKILLSIAVLFSFNSYSQGTTWDEYNYINKGIQQQIENGLDVQKKGYIFDKENSVKYNINDVNFITFTPLLREAKKGKNETIAGIFVEYQYGINYKEFFCLPFACTDLSILNKFYDTLGLYCNDCDLSDHQERLNFVSHILEYSNLYYTTIIAEMLNPTE